MEPRGLVLSASEEVTLRRVALGQSDIGRLPRADLQHLLKLDLVRGRATALSLTAHGRQCIERLRGPARLASFDAEGALRALVDRLMAVAANREKTPPGSNR